MKPSAWTPERIETLKTLWAAHRSAAEIANELGGGLSRCAVLGKIHRLGLSSPAESRQRSLARKTAPAPKRPAKPVLVAPEPLNIPFLALRPPQCRYAVNDAPPYLFCGNPKQSLSPYCAYHHALTHTGPPAN